MKSHEDKLAELQAAIKTQIDEWREIASKCTEVAEKHRSQKDQYNCDVQAAFAYSRNSCAQTLENVLNDSLKPS